ncbi:MAG: hypothetical protein IKV60_01790, partial [Rikenellaceae bacterium]|nr:hypothetical protein [Rikenellaceae bacterium]
MNATKLLRHCLLALAATLTYSCEQPESPSPLPEKEEYTGTITFDINGGEESSFSATGNGEGISLVINQRSTFFSEGEDQSNVFT